MSCAARLIEQQKRRNDLLKEIVRKAIHLCAAFVPLCLWLAYTPTLASLAVCLAGYCIAEALRIKGVSVPIISSVTAAAARKRDENTFVLGPVTLAAGIIITAAAFDPASARVGILALALGDGIASLAGKCFGKTRIPFMRGKTCAGSLACWAAVFAATFAVTGSARSAFWTACAGMALELLPLKDMDNLLLPVALAALNQFLL